MQLQSTPWLQVSHKLTCCLMDTEVLRRPAKANATNTVNNLFYQQTQKVCLTKCIYWWMSRFLPEWYRLRPKWEPRPRIQGKDWIRPWSKSWSEWQPYSPSKVSYWSFCSVFLCLSKRQFLRLTFARNDKVESKMRTEYFCTHKWCWKWKIWQCRQRGCEEPFWGTCWKWCKEEQARKCKTVIRLPMTTNEAKGWLWFQGQSNHVQLSKSQYLLQILLMLSSFEWQFTTVFSITFLHW